MCGSSPDTPDTPDAAPPPAAVPRRVDASVSSARDTERNRLRALAGSSSTIATSASGLTSTANIGGKQLTGQ